MASQVWTHHHWITVRPSNQLNYQAMSLTRTQIQLPRKHINVESTLKQSWLSTFINVVSTLICGWKWKLSRIHWSTVVSTLTEQRWNNIDRITSIQRLNQCCFNVEIWLKMKVELTHVYRPYFKVDKITFNVSEWRLFQCWNLVENESWADVCLSTLFQRWQNNVETTLIELHCFNVDDPMLLQRWY